MTHEQLAAYTHEQLSVYTHEQLAAMKDLESPPELDIKISWRRGSKQTRFRNREARK